MVRIDVSKYIDELKNFTAEAKEIDLYSLKNELVKLNESSKVFEDFEKESMTIGKNTLSQIQNLSSLIKIRNLASEIKKKDKINEKLHSLHFNLNILKNASNISTIKNVLNVFLYNNDSKIDNIINELNDFKIKLGEIKNHHKNLLPKSLDNKLVIENKYNKHIEQLHSIHKKQKNALISTVKLFLKLTKKQIKCQKSKISDHAQKSQRFLTNLKRFKNNPIKQ